MRKPFFLLLVFHLAAYAAPLEIPIRKVPYTIKSSGSYVLARDVVAASGSGISIIASDVTLDLGGFTVAAAVAGGNEVGISVSGLVSNIVIKNGAIRSFGDGVYSNRAITVQTLQVFDSTTTGIYIDTTSANGLAAGATVADCKVIDSGYAGIDVRADGASISNCEVIATSPQPSNTQVGISTIGSGVSITGNRVVNLPSVNHGQAISTQGAGCLIDSNTITATNLGIYISRAIDSPLGDSTTVSNNTVMGAMQGILFQDGDISSNGYYFGNLVVASIGGITYTSNGAHDGGGNKP